MPGSGLGAAGVEAWRSSCSVMGSRVHRSSTRRTQHGEAGGGAGADVVGSWCGVVAMACSSSVADGEAPGELVGEVTQVRGARSWPRSSGFGRGSAAGWRGQRRRAAPWGKSRRRRLRFIGHARARVRGWPSILDVRVGDGTRGTDHGVGTDVQGARRGLPIRSDGGGCGLGGQGRARARRWGGLGLGPVAPLCTWAEQGEGEVERWGVGRLVASPAGLAGRLGPGSVAEPQGGRGCWDGWAKWEKKRNSAQGKRKGFFHF